ncbi:MMPL family transporter [Marinicella sp. S1101]|uniref:efflux RND transporter permease subunit n=1 Tax=Marinicella marina TaxID=2996016 RepID=UPI002260BC47|nr:MMPL family transporter [Marinicella marina]MCX7554785.1 MMPL family transporter [Marinicella marina]MDJ1140982.1 MMPL family transporter [Marinicella marina]
MTDNNSKSKFAAVCESILFSSKKVILFLLFIITIVMAYFASQLKVDAGFEKQLPLDHEYMKTFMEHEKFRGANRILVSIMDESGNMFNQQFFDKLEQMTDAVVFIPGVNRASVKSIFTPNVRFVEVVEDGFAGGNVIPADFSPSPKMFETVRGNIVKAGVLGRLVAEDFNGAMVWADLQERNPQTGEKVDYQEIARQLEEIRTKFEGEGQTVHIIGFAKIVGDIAEGAKSVLYFFALAIFITAVLLYWYSKNWKLTLYPILCSLVAVVWQMGTLKLMGMGIDPMNILTPFLVFAIGVSHGVQMISGWTDKMVHQPVNSRNPDSAARAAFCALLAPGAIALLSDTIGFATIYFINIEIIQELAITATIGVALIIVTNLILLPLLLSGVKMKNYDQFCAKFANKDQSKGVWVGIAGFAKNPLASVAVVLTIGLFVFGYMKSQEMQIGDSQAGVPELRPEARYNQDAMKISSEFALGVDMINVIAETTPNACTESFKAMQNIDRFAWHMSNVEGVQKVITLSQFAKIITAGWNEGNIKWRELSRNNYVMRQSLSGIETDTGLLNQDCSVMPITIFTEDHKATTINKVVAAVKAYQADAPFATDENGELLEGEVKFRLATGNAGVMASTNDVVKGAQMPMLIMVYGAIILLCLITFKSITGTIAIVLPLALVSVLAYALMAFLGIGLKVNTLPVVALGVGIGVDYGIYIFSRLQGLLKQGFSLYEAYRETLKLTGKAVLFTALTLGIGVGTWIFSDLQFQADMGILLAFMFILNMVGALFLLPALAYWLMPKYRKGA